MGCHRSGTNLLYDMLLSSGGFAIYRGFSADLQNSIPASIHENSRAPRRILKTWLHSKGFRRTGLDAEKLSGDPERMPHGGRLHPRRHGRGGRSQQVQRWAVYDPDKCCTWSA